MQFLYQKELKFKYFLFGRLHKAFSNRQESENLRTENKDTLFFEIRKRMELNDE